MRHVAATTEAILLRIRETSLLRPKKQTGENLIKDPPATRFAGDGRAARAPLFFPSLSSSLSRMFFRGRRSVTQRSRRRINSIPSKNVP
jgi:hypothetical protein